MFALKYKTCRTVYCVHVVLCVEMIKRLAFSAYCFISLRWMFNTVNSTIITYKCSNYMHCVYTTHFNFI